MKPADIVEAFEDKMEHFKEQFTMQEHVDDDQMAEALNSFGNLPEAFDFDKLKKGKPSDGSTRDGLTADRKKEQLFHALKQAGYAFKVRGSPMSGRWQRALLSDEKLRQRYDDAKGDSKLMSRIREDWAEGVCEEYLATKSQTTTKTSKEYDKACYLTPKRIAWKEGGGKSGWRNSVNICMNAQLTRGKMIWWDDQALAWKYLYNIKGYSEELAEAFSVHKKWMQKANEGKEEEEEEEEEEKDEAAKDAGEGPPTKRT